MKPFLRVDTQPPQEQVNQLIEDMLKISTMKRKEARQVIEDRVTLPRYVNDKYRVTVDNRNDVVHLSISRVDGSSTHDWRELQEIKNQLVGQDCEGLELYPAESRKVDLANQTHLWVLKDPELRLPIGYTSGQMVNDCEGLFGINQRPHSQGECNEEDEESRD